MVASSPPRLYFGGSGNFSSATDGTRELGAWMRSYGTGGRSGAAKPNCLARHTPSHLTASVRRQGWAVCAPMLARLGSSSHLVPFRPRFFASRVYEPATRESQDKDRDEKEESMSTVGIVVIVVVVALVLLGLFFLLPRFRERARVKKRDLELRQRRKRVIGEHQEEAEARQREAEIAERRARIAGQEAE